MDRLEFHAVLVELLGTNHVYFQPPSKLQMHYPCIVYARDGRDEKFADNLLYNKKQRYSVTVIDPNPDSLIPEKVGSLPMASFTRHFVVDNLNHDIYSVYI